MGPKSDESENSQNVCIHLIENILSEAFRSISERSDSCGFESFESLKIHAFGSEDILNFEAEGVNDPCLADFPETYILSSTISNSSKKGEGDFQDSRLMESCPDMLELRDMEEELNPSCDSILSNNSSPTSLTDDESSQKDLEANLLRDISQFSFSSCDLRSENNGVRESHNHGDATIQSPFPNAEEIENSLSENAQEQDSDNDQQTELRQSQKFCQINDKYFPLGSIETDYHRFINESYLGEDLEIKEDEQELISENSEELANIEGDSSTFNVSFTSKNPFTNPFIVQENLPSIVMKSPTLPGNSSDAVEHTKENSLIKIVADVEPQKHLSDWEESFEVQVTVTELDEPEEIEDKEYVLDTLGVVEEKEDEAAEQDNEKFINRQYWSNTGLVTEHKIKAKFNGLVESSYGIESIPCITRVDEKVILEKSAEELNQTGRELMTNQSTNRAFPSPKYSNNEPHTNNQTSSSGNTEKLKRKKKFLTRLTNSFTNLFISKSKTQKVKSHENV